MARKPKRPVQFSVRFPPELLKEVGAFQDYLAESVPRPSRAATVQVLVKLGLGTWRVR